MTYAFDPATLERIRRHLADVDDLSRRREIALKVTLEVPLPPESLAAFDDVLPDARFVGIFAGQSLDGALDHLGAWRLLAHGPSIPIRAHLTLLRAALEGADRARWHLDAAVASGTRVGRGWAGRRDDQRERKNFETSKEGGPISRPPSRGKSAVHRLAELDETKAIRAREAAGVRTVPYLQATELMVTYGHERWYRLSSGLAHGKEWALAAEQLEPSSDQPLRPKVGSGRFSASEPVALAMTIVAAEAVRAAVADLEAYVTDPIA